MKKLLLSLVFIIASNAHAHPGGHELQCKSALNSGSNQKLIFTLNRSNGLGWYPPAFSLTVNNKKYEFITDDEMKNFGKTFHNSPLGVIYITAENNEDEEASTKANLSITAIPETVKAFDYKGNPVKWNFSEEKSESTCYDSNGKATFKGVFHGYMHSDDSNIPVDTQIMDCELTYNSGMTC